LVPTSLVASLALPSTPLVWELVPALRKQCAVTTIVSTELWRLDALQSISTSFDSLAELFRPLGIVVWLTSHIHSRVSLHEHLYSRTGQNCRTNLILPSYLDITVQSGSLFYHIFPFYTPLRLLITTLLDIIFLKYMSLTLSRMYFHRLALSSARLNSLVFSLVIIRCRWGHRIPYKVPL